MASLNLFSLIAFAAGTTALIVSALLFITTRRMRDRLDALLAGTDRETVEEALVEYYQRVQKAERRLQALHEHHDHTSAVAHHSLHQCGIVRFNPFPGEIGGDQSFSIALLDGDHNGVIITALHSREGTRIYSKPIESGTSHYPLSDEEEKAVRNALTPES